MAGQCRLLVVVDDPAIGDLLVQIAEGLVFQTAYVECSDELLNVCRVFRPNLIILDLMMPGIDGIQSLRALADEKFGGDIILFSGADTRALSTATRLGECHGLQVRELLRKPFEVGELEAALRRFMKPSMGDLGLSEVVIEKAARAISALRQDGHSLDLAVNISPLMLATPDTPDRLSQILDQHRLDTPYLIVEITEGAAMGDGSLTMENLTRFRLKGMKLSMDDFGTGFSSLVQLYRMPFSELRIDKSFVMEHDTKEDARIIVRSVVDLVHNLNLTICAEGVETRETPNFLRSIGCDQAQDYLISKPLDDADLARFLTGGASNHAAAAVAGGERQEDRRQGVVS